MTASYNESVPPLNGLVIDLFSSYLRKPRARKELHQLLTSLPKGKLSTFFDSLYTFRHYFGYCEAWQKLKPSQVSSMAGKELSRVSLLGLFSHHHNGFVRGEAVKHLAQIHDGSEFPYLLLRLNDWVDPIHVEASNAVSSRISPAYVSSIVESLPLIFRLLQATRRDHTLIVRQIFNCLYAAHPQQCWEAIISLEDQKLFRSAILLAIETPGPYQKDFLMRGLHFNDVVILRACAKSLWDSLTSEEVPAVIKRLKQEPYSVVRKEAFLHEVKFYPEAAQKIWQEALFDRSSSIRELARFYLARLGETDTTQLYQQALEADPNSLVALTGLVESGNRTLLPILHPYASHPLPSRRKVALLGLARLSGTDATAELIGYLSDDSPSVTKRLQREIATRILPTHAAQLYELICKDTRPHVRFSALSLIDELSKWASLPWLIRVAGFLDIETASTAETMLGSWFEGYRMNQAFTSPTSAEAAEIETVRSECDCRLSPKFAIKLNEWLART